MPEVFGLSARLYQSRMEWNVAFAMLGRKRRNKVSAWAFAHADTLFRQQTLKDTVSKAVSLSVVALGWAKEGEDGMC
jgi:hypothetical protein